MLFVRDLTVSIGPTRPADIVSGVSFAIERARFSDWSANPVAARA